MMLLWRLVPAFTLVLAGCVGVVAPYDAAFDQSLNRLSEDAAKFLAAASTGGNERSFGSQESVAFYAATYNVLDRLSQRAALTRGAVACPTNTSLTRFVSTGTSNSTLPEDYRRFDCREFQLYAVRLYVDQLNYAHRSDGTLNRSEATALGGALQGAILGAIETFIANKAES